MFLSSIKLNNFRNYSDFAHTFTKNVLFLVGPNGAGKTNFLESLRVLSLSKSFRARRDTELIQFDKDFTRVEGKVKLAKRKVELAVVIERNGRTAQKSIQINNKPARALDLIGKMTTVLFAPDDLNLIFNPPTNRRRYLDITICQVDPLYCRVLNEYQQVLRNRNQLLARVKDGQAGEAELDFWDEKLLAGGRKITRVRQDLTTFYNNCLTKMYGKINQGEQKLLLCYRPNIAYENDDSFDTEFRAQLLAKRQLEIQRACSLVGPQRDDFNLTLAGRNLSAYGSRGEVRSAIIALKLAELDFFAQKLGQRPILLLDDIFSELDQRRRQRLVETFDQQQTIITTTDLSFIDQEAINKGEVLQANG
ncbi:DNA replication/repair protein RecF [Patescibacteria group bacterium]|nr:DNA replication/repair protein RecF [Patescibacteria group bacterium]